ncbi:MAG: hypothetical protein ACRC8S_12375 [Fimbriiglobus sp.]
MKKPSQEPRRAKVIHSQPGAASASPATPVREPVPSAPKNPSQVKLRFWLGLVVGGVLATMFLVCVGGLSYLGYRLSSDTQTEQTIVNDTSKSPESPERKIEDKPSSSGSPITNQAKPVKVWRKAWSTLESPTKDFTVQMPIGTTVTRGQLYVGGTGLQTMEISSEEGPASYCVYSILHSPRSGLMTRDIATAIFRKYSSQTPTYLPFEKWGLQYEEVSSPAGEVKKTKVILHRNEASVWVIVMTVQTDKLSEYAGFIEENHFSTFLGSLKTDKITPGIYPRPATPNYPFEVQGIGSVSQSQVFVALPASQQILCFANSKPLQNYSTAYAVRFSTTNWKKVSEHDLGIPVDSANVHEASNQLILGGTKSNDRYGDEIHSYSGPSELIAYDLDQFLEDPRKAKPKARFKSQHLLLGTTLSQNGESLYTMEFRASYKKPKEFPAVTRILKLNPKTLVVEREIEIQMGLRNLVLSPDGNRLVASEYQYGQYREVRSGGTKLYWLNTDTMTIASVFEMPCKVESCSFRGNDQVMVSGLTTDGKMFCIAEASPSYYSQILFMDANFKALRQIQFDPIQNRVYGYAWQTAQLVVFEWTGPLRLLTPIATATRLDLPGNKPGDLGAGSLSGPLLVSGQDLVMGSGAVVRIVKK